MDPDSPSRREFEAQLAAINSKMDLRFGYAEQALMLSRTELERRLEGMNEFRLQLERQAGTFVSKTELHTELEKVELKIVPLIKVCDQGEGSRRWTDYLIMAIISVVIVGVFKLLIP